MDQTQQPIPAPDQKKGRGCFFWGCVTLVVIAAVILGVAGFGGYYLYTSKVGPLIAEYTSTESVTLPQVEISEAQLSDVHQRLETFRQAAKAHQQTSLELTAQEINGLINSDPQFHEAKGKIYVTLDNDQIGGEISVPLDAFMLKGRYLNGRIILNVTTDEGGLRVTIAHLEVNGRSAGPEVIAQLRDTNLADRSAKDPQLHDIIARVRNVTVDNGVLKIALR